MFGVQMQMVARGYLTYDLTENPGLVGIVIGGSAVPMLIFSLFGGVLSDRINKKILIQVGQISSTLIAKQLGSNHIYGHPGVKYPHFDQQCTQILVL